MTNTYPTNLRDVTAHELFSRPEIKKSAFAILIVICAARWYAVMTGPFQTHWALDFQYFWLAGQFWLEGKSAYLPNYLVEGASHTPIFSSPFFYPPAILPLLAPLGLTSMEAAAAWLFAVNLGLLMLTAPLLAQIAKHQYPAIDPMWVYVFFAVLLSIFMRPVMKVIVFGQMTMILATALAAFIYGIQNNRRNVVICSLTTLLLKPHIGLGLLVYALWRKNLRLAGVYAVALTGLLSIAGLMVDQPVASAIGYIQNVTSYGDQPENAIGATGGLGLLLSYIGVELNAFITVSSITAIATLVAYHSFGNVIAPTMLIITSAFFVSPHHSTDFVLLSPAFLLLLESQKNYIRVCMGLTLLLLCRSWDTATFLLQAPETSVKWFVAIEHTFAFLALLILITATTISIEHTKSMATV